MEENKGIYLLKKSKRGILRLVFSRIGLMFLMLLVQIGLLGSIFFCFEELLNYLLVGNVIFSVITVLYLLNNRMNPSVKITWLIVIMLLPIFGCMLLAYTQSELGNRALKAVMNQIYRQTQDALPENTEVYEAFQKEAPGSAALVHYVQRSGCFPLFHNTEVTYFPTGRDKWNQLLLELEQAEKFIFLEYFIIDEGLMWGKILEILAKKAKEGVEVRVMYDGTCEFSTLPHDYPKRLNKLGIKCHIFSPVTPFLSTHYNYRDHRKILVIDGRVGFTGGVNLADEYINEKEKYGVWKDTAIMLKGEAVQSLTLMFLQMWALEERDTEYAAYLTVDDKASAFSENGFVLPYGDNPMDYDKVGERVYMDLLNRAQKNVFIMTPYLILDGELETALKFAAERGVRVVLILPGIPDKKAPYALAKTHYKSLLESGVEIYEFTKGFVHAKVFYVDGKEAVVGTINMDYRSLYHHFECATYMYQTKCLTDIEKDFIETLAECTRATEESIQKEKVSRKLLGIISKAIAPLM